LTHELLLNISKFLTEISTFIVIFERNLYQEKVPISNARNQHVTLSAGSKLVHYRYSIGNHGPLFCELKLKNFGVFAFVSISLKDQENQ